MRQLFQAVLDRLSQNEPLVLVTITAASGATPRGAGARMLVGTQGRICGTIGGGAVEYRAICMAKEVLEDKTSRSKAFTLNRQDVENLGMICGGNVEVFFHYLPAGDPLALALAEKALASMERGADLWLLTDVAAGEKMGLYTPDEGFWGLEAPLPLPRKAARLGDLLAEQIWSASRVYIFGGGHVAQELAPVLSHVGFRCVVMDDRPEFADPRLFPTAEQVILGNLEKIDDFVTITSRDYVCVMTRGHAYDTAVQAQILRRQPCYCGVIGSRKKAAGVRKALREDHGLTDDLLDRITTPIGLEIEAETPAEIAISICAQMIRHRALQA